MLKLKSDVYDSSDLVYYNVIMHNPGNTAVPAEFAEVRTVPIVDDPSQYYLSVIRFLIPGQNIPIFQFNAVNPNTGISPPSAYEITLSYAGVDYSNFVLYNPQTVTPFPSPNYYFIFSYQQMIQQINAAFASAWEALNNANPGISNYPPYLTFNPVTQIITLNVETTAGAYVPASLGGNYIQIWFNNTLYSVFENFDNFFNGDLSAPKNFQIIVKNTGVNIASSSNSPDPITYALWQPFETYNINDVVNYLNVLYRSTTNNNVGNVPTAGLPWTVPYAQPAHYTGPIYQINQEFASLYNWNGFRNIVFTTGTIPIQAEFIPSFVTQQGQSTGQVVPGTNSYRRILTDFIPSVELGPDARSYMIYNPTSEYRLVSFTSSEPLRRFDVSIFWQDNNNNLFPLLLPPNDEATVKFVFRKRSFNSGYLNIPNLEEMLKSLFFNVPTDREMKEIQMSGENIKKEKKKKKIRKV